MTRRKRWRARSVHASLQRSLQKRSLQKRSLQKRNLVQPSLMAVLQLQVGKVARTYTLRVRMRATCVVASQRMVLLTALVIRSTRVLNQSKRRYFLFQRSRSPVQRKSGSLQQKRSLTMCFVHTRCLESSGIRRHRWYSDLLRIAL